MIRKPHYAWVICICCFFMLMSTMGFCNNVIPTYIPYLKQQGLTGTQASALISLRCLFGIIGMIFVNRFFKCFSIRIGLFLTCLIAAFSFGIYAAARQPAVYFAAAAVCGIGYGFGSMIPVGILMKSWFYEKISTAIGIAATGTGFSTIFFPPLITVIIECFGTTAAFLFQMLIILVIAFGVLIFVRDTPEKKGVKPYGNIREEPLAKRGCESDFRNITKTIMIFTLVCAVCGCVTAAAPGHFSLLLTMEGYSPIIVSYGVSIFGISMTLGKFICGIQFDKWGTRLTSIVFLIISVAGSCFICITDGISKGILFGGLILMGFGLAVAIVGVPIWAAEFSNGSSYQMVLTRFQIAYSVGGMIFSMVPGIIYDYTGSYKNAYILMTLLLISTVPIIIWGYRIQICKVDEK